jgi:putative Ca2+/H+ antiporter (TMEM165/GDT1 family)
LIDFSAVAFLASFLFVVLAEMGDKTQLLAMAFATHYNAYKVLFAVFVATIANHALAVAVGQYLTTIVPINVISLAASLSFIGFGLWTIRGDALKQEPRKGARLGAVATVAIAFFVAEMGDKTQLATVSLAVEYQSMFSILMGTTLGMVAANAIGVVIGVVMRKRVPERKIKWISAGIFIFFGVLGVYNVLSLMVGLGYSVLAAGLLAAFSVYAAYRLSKKRNKQG